MGLIGQRCQKGAGGAVARRNQKVDKKVDCIVGGKRRLEVYRRQMAIGSCRSACAVDVDSCWSCFG